MKIKNVPLLFEAVKTEDGEIIYLVRHPQNGLLLYFGSAEEFGFFVESLFNDIDKQADKASL